VFDLRYSVVIPAHNAESTILKCIDSVLNQTTRPSKIIVVCDTCSDGTASQIESYDHPNISILHVNFLSSAESRNFGVEHSASEYIAFIDADDLWMPTKIEKQIPLILDSKNNAIVATNSIYINNYGTKVGRNVRTTDDEHAKLMLKAGLGMPALLSTWFLSRSTFLDLGGFDRRLPMSEDFDFAYRAVNSGVDFKMVREPLSLYLLHSDSKTAQHKIKQQRVAAYVRNRSHSTIELNFTEFINQKISITERRDAFVDIQIRKFLISAKPAGWQRNYFRLVIAFILNPKKMCKKYLHQRN